MIIHSLSPNELPDYDKTHQVVIKRKIDFEKVQAILPEFVTEKGIHVKTDQHPRYSLSAIHRLNQTMASIARLNTGADVISTEAISGSRFILMEPTALGDIFIHTHFLQYYYTCEYHREGVMTAEGDNSTFHTYDKLFNFYEVVFAVVPINLP